MSYIPPKAYIVTAEAHKVIRRSLRVEALTEEEARKKFIRQETFWRNIPIEEEVIPGKLEIVEVEDHS